MVDDPAVELVLFPALPMPDRSPAARCCAECERYAPGGLYGPPGIDLVTGVGWYHYADCWYCLRCGLVLWDHWRWRQPRIEQRRAEVRAWLAAMTQQRRARGWPI